MSLMHEDLKGTVCPFISIDEFEPKSGVNTEIIVVAFYADAEGPAKDLNTFIQRGSFDVLDTEVSPNPDENGRYLIFVEFERNELFVETFAKFIRDVENLTGKQDWQVKPYLADNAMHMDDPDLYKFIITEPGSYQTKDEYSGEAEIAEAFKDTAGATLTIREGYVILSSYRDSVAAKIEEFGNTQAISSKHRLKENAINLTPPTEVHCLDDMLGLDWEVYDLGKYVVLENNNDEVLLVSNVQFFYGRDA